MTKLNNLQEKLNNLQEKTNTSVEALGKSIERTNQVIDSQIDKFGTSTEKIIAKKIWKI